MYQKFKAFLFVFILSTMLASCVSVQPPVKNTIKIRGLKINNLTGQSIDKITLIANTTHKFVSCGYIADGGECSTGFPLKEYQGNSMSIRWEQNNQHFFYDNIYVEQYISSNFRESVYVVVSLKSNTKPTAVFVQSTGLY